MVERKDEKGKPVLTSEDPDTFRAILEGAACTPSIAVIGNRFPWQSRMASEKLLDVAAKRQETVRMLSGGGPEGFYNDGFTVKLKACKDAGCPFIRVMVWQKDDANVSKALRALAGQGVIELRVSGTDEFAERIPHFLLVGKNAYRQEATHERFTCKTRFTDMEPKVPARIDFDDKETGAELAAIFDDFWSIA